VLAVEEGCWHRRDEELAAVGVWAGILGAILSQLLSVLSSSVFAEIETLEGDVPPWTKDRADHASA
jgi:hypothetical protein